MIVPPQQPPDVIAQLTALPDTLTVKEQQEHFARLKPDLVTVHSKFRELFDAVADLVKTKLGVSKPNLLAAVKFVATQQKQEQAPVWDPPDYEDYDHDPIAYLSDLKQKPSPVQAQEMLELLTPDLAILFNTNSPAYITATELVREKLNVAKRDLDMLMRPLSERPGKVSQATMLVNLAVKVGVELWHDPDKELWASFPVGGHTEHARIKTQPFRRYLRKLYRDDQNGAPGSQGVQDAVAQLESIADFEGQEHPVFVRVGEHNGCVYLDLGNDAWEAVEIMPLGWHVITNPPVRFDRPKGMTALPIPTKGGSLEDLRPFLNVASDDDWMFVKAWLLGALSPQGPYPILALYGEPGAAKSTHARLLRACIDPSTVPLRRPPKEEEDLIVAAKSSWVLPMDNLSRIPGWLSDALCGLSTGGGISRRARFTDSEVSLIDVQRPVILTGIGDLATRSDLLSRSIPLVLTEITQENRVDEKRIWRKFRTLQPRILGALLDAMSCGLKNLPTTKLARSPRMADFARLVAAASPKMGFTAEQFLAGYETKHAEQHATALESSMIGQLIMKLVVENKPFEGTAQKLLTEVTALATDAEKKLKYFPTSPRTLAGTVRDIAPHLRAEGYTVGEKPRTKNARILKIEWVGKTSSPSSPSSPTAKTHGFFDDVGDDEVTMGDDGDDEVTMGDDEVTIASPLSSPKKGHDSNDLDTKNGSGDDGDDELPTQSSCASDEMPEDEEEEGTWESQR